jgi:hypothetical protein
MGRRRCQQPSVFKTKSKRPEWYFRARVDVLVGPGQTERKEKPHYLGYVDKMGKRDAERARNTILEQAINRPALLIQSQVKFSQVLEAYRRDHLPTLRAVTAKAYGCYVRRIDADFGALRLCDITPQMLQAWCNGLPAGSKRQFITHFNIIWKKARAWGYTTVPTPAEFVSYGTRKLIHTKSIPTVEQYAKLRAALRSPLDDMSDVAVMMGLRISEIRGLPVRCIDLAAGCIRIEQRLDELNELDDPKSRKSARALPMGSLKAMFARAIAGKNPDDLIFSGAPSSYSQCQDLFKAAAVAAGCDAPHFGWHALRRCHNTWLRKAGASAQDAMNQMGHSTTQVNDLYIVVESDDYERRERLVLALQDKLIGKPTGGVN